MTALDLQKFRWHQWEQDPTYFVDERSGRIFHYKEAVRITRNRLNDAALTIARLIIAGWDEQGLTVDERDRRLRDFDQLSRNLSANSHNRSV